MIRALALALGLLGAGCFGPSLGDEPFLCGTAPPLCPPSYTCDPSSRICVAGEIPDARLGDAPLSVDAAPPADAGPTPPCDPAIDAPTDAAEPPDARRADARPADARPADARPIDAAPVDARPCVPGCEGDVLFTCNGDGTSNQTVCPAGCDPSTPPACFVLQPQHLSPTMCSDEADRPPTIPAGETPLDTSICAGGEVVAQDDGAPELCVFHWESLTVPVNATLKVSGARGVAIVTSGNMTILGAIDASATGNDGGPGAQVGALSQGGPGPFQTSVGGGGGGGATQGAAGGSSSSGDVGASGGVPHPDEKVLRAGAFGGPGGDQCGFAGCPAHGGGGGGALYLVACGTLQLGASSVIDASGGGGAGGEAGSLLESAWGGDGGGSGGDIVIEASIVLANGGAKIGSNGGGGGGGGSSTSEIIVGAPGEPGTDGSPVVTRAPGGPAAMGGGAGGAGGTGSTQLRAPVAGAPPTAKGGAGGGGGSAGRIRAYARPDHPIVFPSGAIVTPPPTVGTITRAH